VLSVDRGKGGFESNSINGGERQKMGGAPNFSLAKKRSESNEGH